MTDKVQTFKHAFAGRQNVVPKFWQAKTGKSGYSPLCKKEWQEGICQKPCRSCSNADYIPLSDSLILDHFKGKHILGVYPLLQNNTCHFIAADFDDHQGGRDPLADVTAYYEACQVQDIPRYLLRSKSGKGYHAYIFFNAPVPAWKARIVAFALLQEAGVIGDDAKLSTFDRLFPNQDELTGRGFGNLIALPFQGQAARNGHTLFLDPESGFQTPFGNQWEILAEIKKASESQLDELVQSWNLKRETVSKTYGGGKNGNKDAVERLLSCKFISWCKTQPEKVPEPLWYSLISNAISIRPGGVTLAHELSKEHPDYTSAETDNKILQALDASGPHTCRYINSNGFDCGNDCGVKAPAALVLLYPSKKENKNGEPDEERHRIEISIG
jgi:hypothetical protein